MGLSYFLCELCGADLMFRYETNANKFPADRQFRDPSSEKELLSVRCAECAKMPYKLEEGRPSRARYLGREDAIIQHEFSGDYHYWPLGFGHLLELWAKSPPDEIVNSARNRPVSIGFFVEEQVNLIVLAFHLENTTWRVAPYQWHAYQKWTCAVPSDTPVSESERDFTVALIDSKGGKYRAIRKGIMPLDFATAFHQAINEQIARGVPDLQQHNARLNHLHEWLDEKKLVPALRAQCLI